MEEEKNRDFPVVEADLKDLAEAFEIIEKKGVDGFHEAASILGKDGALVLVACRLHKTRCLASEPMDRVLEMIRQSPFYEAPAPIS